MQTKNVKRLKALEAEEKRLMRDLKVEFYQGSTLVEYNFERWFYQVTPTNITQRLSVINDLRRNLGEEPKTLNDYRALLEV